MVWGLNRSDKDNLFAVPELVPACLRLAGKPLPPRMSGGLIEASAYC